MKTQLIDKFIAELQNCTICRSEFESRFISLANAPIDPIIRELSGKITEDCKNVFSRLALLHMKAGHIDQALKFFAMDAEMGRQTWWYELRHAEALYLNGHKDAAIQLITCIYSKEPEAVNGFSEIAWRHGDVFDTTTKELYQRDIFMNRMSAGFRLNYAITLAKHTAIQDAIQEVESAYKENSTIKDGYVRIARAYHLPRKDYRSLANLCQRDMDQSRISPQGMLHLAEAYAFSGNIDEAEILVSEAYSQNPDLKDGYVRIARAYFSSRHHFVQLADYCSRDKELGRITTSGSLTLAYSLMHIGRSDDALATLQRVDDIPQGAYAQLAESWVRSFHWAHTHSAISDPVIQMLREKQLELCPSSPNNELPFLHAITQISAAKQRLANASLRTGIDLASQLQDIAQRRYRQHDPSETFAFLNSRLLCSNPSDLFVLFNEHVINESDLFRTDNTVPFIIDGGANIGAAIAYFKWLYPNAYILAFEPNPQLFEICQQNIDINNWENVTLLPYALASESGQLQFHCDLDMPMASSLSSRPKEEGREFNSVSVNARTLSEYMKQQVDFLKLDIEGAEAGVIAELSDGLSMAKAGIIEYHHHDGSKNTLSSIIQALEKNGHSYIIKHPIAICSISNDHRISKRWSQSILFRKRIKA